MWFTKSNGSKTCVLFIIFVIETKLIKHKLNIKTVDLLEPARVAM